MTAVTEKPTRTHSEWFWTELAILRERWSPLVHPFYERWTVGTLDVNELMQYASEYDHAVVAIADASRRAADRADGLLGEALRAHAREEKEHVHLWRAFARVAGWGGAAAWYYAEEPLGATISCASCWAGDAKRSLPEHLVTLYAVESAQPAVAAATVESLVERYGFDDGPGIEYFRLHAVRDHDHADLLRAALDGLLADADPFALLHQANRAYRAHWDMLDGLQCLSS